MQLRDDRPGIAWPGYWTILGGGVEKGETSASAVVREVHEESGLRVSNLTLVTLVVDKAGSGQRLDVYETFVPDDIELQLGEGRDLRFVGDEERRQLRIPPFVIDLLDTYVRS
jgi:8-oxo-dGTP diphosphatase